MALPLQRSFDDLGAPLFGVPFCVVDLETTGGSPADCEITEIGAVRYRGGELEATFAGETPALKCRIVSARRSR